MMISVNASLALLTEVRGQPRIESRRRLRDCRQAILTPLHPSDDHGGADAQGFANSQENLQGRRLLAKFQQTDVIARDIRLERKLFLRQTSGDSRFSQLFPKRRPCKLKFASQAVFQR